MLPSFFVLGAQKAGTTALDAWLRQQRGIELPDLKETHFLSDDERHAKGLDWYLARFRAAAPSKEREPLRGEVDPDYLSDARVPARMARLYAEAAAPPALVAVLRDPLERAFSQWRMTRRRGLEQRPFREALEASFREADELGGGHHDYFGRGCYASHLDRFRRALPAAPLFVLTFDELFGEQTRAEAFARVCAFIGLSGEPLAPDFDKQWNPAGRPRSLVLNRVLQRRGLVRRALGRLVPSQDLRLRLGVLFERANTRPDGEEGEYEGPLPAAAVDALLDEVERVERDFSLDLSGWKTKRGGS